MPFVVTTAVKLPAAFGPLDNETVNAFAVEAVTLPMTPLLNATKLLFAVVSNPNPLIVSVVASAFKRKPVFASTNGVTFATCTAAPLLTPLEVTMAV